MPKGRHRLARRLKRRMERHEPGELNITAFMNLMVILVPFLLIGAIFSQIAIVELNLPLSQSASTPRTDAVPKPKLMLVIRDSSITVTEQSVGDLARFDWHDEQRFDWEAFFAALDDVKFALPEVRDITLLSEPDIEYQVLVTFMDRLSAPNPANKGRAYFPAISLGSAPPLAITAEATP